MLTTVRTYPTPARKGVEVSCTGGITDHGQWIRLFPVPYRFLEPDQRFSKYQWIEAQAAKSSDERPESYQVDTDSIRILSPPLPTADKWMARKQLVLPLMAPSLCQLQRARRESKASMGFFKPHQIAGLDIEPEDNPHWTLEEQAKLLQYDLFQKRPFHPLEKIPFKFCYRFTCSEPGCKGHRLSCVDWELGQAYRSWRRRYGQNWERALRNRFEYEMVERFDTHFFVGTVRAYPNSWIIVGLFYPLR